MGYIFHRTNTTFLLFYSCSRVQVYLLLGLEIKLCLYWHFLSFFYYLIHTLRGLHLLLTPWGGCLYWNTWAWTKRIVQLLLFGFLLAILAVSSISFWRKYWLFCFQFYRCCHYIMNWRLQRFERTDFRVFIGFYLYLKVYLNNLQSFPYIYEILFVLNEFSKKWFFLVCFFENLQFIFYLLKQLSFKGAKLSISSKPILILWFFKYSFYDWNELQKLCLFLSYCCFLQNQCPLYLH